jgi:hypothetical protein
MGEQKKACRIDIQQGKPITISTSVYHGRIMKTDNSGSKVNVIWKTNL